MGEGCAAQGLRLRRERIGTKTSISGTGIVGACAGRFSRSGPRLFRIPLTISDAVRFGAGDPAGAGSGKTLAAVPICFVMIAGASSGGSRSRSGSRAWPVRAPSSRGVWSITACVRRRRSAQARTTSLHPDGSPQSLLHPHPPQIIAQANILTSAQGFKDPVQDPEACFGDRGETGARCREPPFVMRREGRLPAVLPRGPLRPHLRRPGGRGGVVSPTPPRGAARPAGARTEPRRRPPCRGRRRGGLPRR